MKDIAIKNIHPNVTTVVGGIDATDKDGYVVELDDSKIATELTRLEAEYDAQEYARNRQGEYPTIEELTIALYDTDDKAALETKRAAVKTKWPKDNSGPV